MQTYCKTFLTHSLTIALLFSVFLCSSSFANNSFLVAPTKVEFDVDKPKINSFIVSNNGTEKIRIRVKPVYFPTSSRQMKLGSNFKPDGDSIDNLAPYIKVSPKTFSLKPGQKRTLRISIRSPKDLAPGEYRAHLLVSMLELAHKAKNTVEKGKIGMQLSFKMETAVAIYGRKGTGKSKLTLDHCNINEKGKLFVTMTNHEPWRFDGWLNIESENGFEKTVKHFMLRETIRSIEVEKPDSELKKLKISWTKMNEKKPIGESSCNVTYKKSIADQQNFPLPPVKPLATKPEAKPETKVEATPEAKPETKVEATPEAKPEKKEKPSIFTRFFQWLGF